jgi:TusA-related sulfurtransferase
VSAARESATAPVAAPAATAGGAPRRTELDLAGVPCPLNWVRARLALEGMAAGDQLVLRLDAGEPRQSVPLAAREDGHAVAWEGDLLTVTKR